MANRTGKNSVGKPIALKINTRFKLQYQIQEKSKGKQELIPNDIPINKSRVEIHIWIQLPLDKIFV
jgi:hypothetical protein